MNKKAIFADSSLLFVAFIWGSTFVLVQNAIDLIPPITFIAIRFLIASIILGFWLIVFQREQLKYINKQLIFSGIIIGLWLFFGYATQTIGLLYTSSSKAGFITGLNVVLVPIFSYFILKLMPSKNAIIGVFIATVGLFLLTMTDVSPINQGDILVFFCAIGFALQIVYTGKYSSKYPSLLLTVVQISTVCILSIIYSLFFEDYKLAFSRDVILDSEVVLALFITSVFATALAFFAQTNFQKYTTPTRVALIFATEPVFAAVTGYFFAQDRLSTTAIFGCLFILLGMILAELPSGKLFHKKMEQKGMNQKTS